MIRTEPIIAVENVERSSKWYQELLNCKSNHGGNTFEVLSDENDTTILCLHKWGDHEHPTLADSTIRSGNGLILYFRVSDLDEIWENAKSLNVFVEEAPNLNKSSGKNEFSIRDLDGYYLLISE